MRKFARHRNGLKEARDAIVASRAARAALRIADSESDMSSDDDMEAIQETKTRNSKSL
jgi:hypothetical protein